MAVWRHPPPSSCARRNVRVESHMALLETRMGSLLNCGIMDFGEVMGSFLSQSFYQLTPDEVMKAVERLGFRCTGEYYQLNSYENRVFDIRLEEALSGEAFAGALTSTTPSRLIVKFYRPHRWSKKALLEEHQFLSELTEEGFPVFAPLTIDKGTVFESAGIYFAVFARGLGRMPQELIGTDFLQVGRALARLHNIGERHPTSERLWLGSEDFGDPALEALEDHLSVEMRSRYYQAAEEILAYLDERLIPEDFIRIHGDCHRGNLLKTDRAGEAAEFFFVDFDDFCMGPVAQDFWMLLSGGEESVRERDLLIQGYEELRRFPLEQLVLFEALRGLRIIHYAGWIARRWEDPSFPHLFPQFHDYNYWAEEVEALEAIASAVTF